MHKTGRFLIGVNDIDNYEKVIPIIAREIKKSYNYPLILTYAHEKATIDQSIKQYIQYSFCSRHKDWMKLI
jgi:hypothetical protein